MNAIQKLYKKKTFVLKLVVLLFLLIVLAFVIHATSSNNLVWLKGTWRNNYDSFVLIPKNNHYTSWKIKEHDTLQLDNATITIKSNKQKVQLTDDDDKICYTIQKINKTKIRLTLVKKGEQIKKEYLTKA